MSFRLTNTSRAAERICHPQRAGCSSGTRATGLRHAGRFVNERTTGAALFAALFCAWPCWAQAQLASGSGSAPDIDYVRVVLALALCLALAISAAWWLKKKGLVLPSLTHVSGAGQRLRVIESVRLHVRATLYVVEFEGRRVLIAADSSGVVRLAESGAPPAAAADPVPQ